MVTIKVSCPECGVVELGELGVDLQLCPLSPALSFYEFVCPSCSLSIRKHADDHVVSLLLSNGVLASSWSVPAEALEPKTGPVLDWDDLLDFGLWLGTTDLIAKMLSKKVAPPA